jgi:DNA-binding protein H-NS
MSIKITNDSLNGLSPQEIAYRIAEMRKKQSYKSYDEMMRAKDIQNKEKGNKEEQPKKKKRKLKINENTNFLDLSDEEIEELDFNR